MTKISSLQQETESQRIFVEVDENSFPNLLDDEDDVKKFRIINRTKIQTEWFDGKKGEDNLFKNY